MSLQQITPSRGTAVHGRRGWAVFLVGFALIWTVLQVTGSPEPTPARNALALAATLACAVAVLAVAMRVPRPLRTLGLGRPTSASIAVAVGVSAACLGAYALFPVVTGRDLALQPGWPGLLVGVWLFNGVAEELAWRGYVFGRLRQGRSFGHALLPAMVILSLTHVPILISSGWVVGLAAMLVAAVTTVPLASLYEQGGATIWAPALLHAAIDAFRVLAVDPTATLTFSLYVSGVALVVPLSAVVLGRFVTTRRREATDRAGTVAAVPVGTGTRRR
jgi:membrane protease YdiL (CAAX protease family)